MKVRYYKDKKKFEITEANRMEYATVHAALERFKAGYKYDAAFKRRLWDGKIKPIKDGVFALGLWKQVATALADIGCKFIIENKEDFPINRDITRESVVEFCNEFFKDHKYKDKKTGEIKKFEVYEHQIDSAYGVLRNRYCTAEVATGGGKTLIISIVYFYILSILKKDAKFLIIVPSISLVTQFFDEIMTFNVGIFKENKNPLDLRMLEIMSDKPRKWHGDGEPNIIISTYNSLANITNFGRKFYLQFYGVACDEAHMSKSNSHTKIMTRTIINAEYQFGVSGTFHDDNSAEYIMAQEVTGPKVVKVKARELQEKKILSWLKIYQYILDHNDGEFEELIHDINGRDKYNLEKDYVANSQNRMKFIAKLLSKLKNNTLILFNKIEGGERLMDYCIGALNEFCIENKTDFFFEAYIVKGDVKKDDRKDIFNLMEAPNYDQATGKNIIRILFATYGTLSTGISINNIHNIILAESFKSEQRIIQSIGRALRLHENKILARIFDLVDIYNINTYKKDKNILYIHGIERNKMYIEHQYPCEVKTICIN